MNFFILVFIFYCWFALGYKSFVFWWTHDYDYTSDMKLTAYTSALLGPGAFIAGYFIHGLRPKEPTQSKKVIVPKRKKVGEDDQAATDVD